MKKIMSHRLLFFVAACLCAVPVLIPSHPPMVDLPQHAAAIATMDSIFHGNYPYADLFQMKWITPYWIGYLLIWLASQVFGIVLASKIVVACAIVGFIFACQAVRKHIHAPPLLDWLFLSVPFGFAYYWGFLNFVIALPFGILFIKYYLKYLDGKWSWGWLVVAINFLFFAHLLVTFFVIAVCITLTLKPHKPMASVVKTVLPLFSILPVLIIWLLINFAHPSKGSGPWEMGIHRVFQLLPGIFSIEPSWTNIAVSAGLLSIPWLLGGRLKWNISSLGPFVFYTLFMLLAPNYLMGNFFTYNRFNCLGLVLYIFCFDFSHQKQGSSLSKIQPLMGFAVPVIACLFLVRVALHHYYFDIESRGFNTILSKMEPNKRALSLAANRNSEFFKAPVYLHYSVWYQAQKNGLVDFNFAYWPGLNLTYKDKFRPTAGADFVWYPHTFEWEHYHADLYDYFVVKANDDFTQAVLGRYADRLVLVAKVDDWWLFENKHPKHHNQ